MGITIVPYTAFGPLNFNEATQDECLQLLGEPLHTRINRKGNVEFEYQHFIIRFNPHTRTVRECTLLPYADATISDITITWDRHFLRLACEQDQSAKNVYGFIVLERLGIAVTGIHDNDSSQLSITAYSKGDFNDLLPGSTPYVEW